MNHFVYLGLDCFIAINQPFENQTIENQTIEYQNQKL
jgi:hypothetical protein